MCTQIQLLGHETSFSAKGGKLLKGYYWTIKVHIIVFAYQYYFEVCLR